MSDVEAGRVRRFITIASGATRSSDLVVEGYSCAQAVFPAGFKGFLRYRARNSATGASGRWYDETATSPVTANVGALTKPLSMALNPKIIKHGKIVNVCASSAQTAPKTIDVWLKYAP